MGLRPPGFAVGEGFDAVKEFRLFVKSTKTAGGLLLVDLAKLQNFGAFSDIPTADRDATRISNLYCRICDGWAVFYTAHKGFPFEITVILVGDIKQRAFSEFEADAAERIN